MELVRGVCVVCAGMGLGLAALGADVVMRPDGEVRTVADALARVRTLRAAGTLPKDRCAEVRVESGRYPVTEAAVFTPADSNVRFVAAEDGKAVFDGGVRLAPFAAGADGVWRAKVPENLVFEQLYVNGRRAQRARTPNKFYLYMSDRWDGDVDPRTGQAANLERSAFYARTNDVARLASLPTDELRRVEILCWQSWDQGRAKVDFVDGRTGAVLMKTGMGFPLFYWDSSRPRYAFENYRAALDAPGEWFHDVKAGELLYIPLRGETPDRTTAVVPVTREFIRFAGDPLKGAFVENVALRGLVFEYASWILPPEGGVNHQSAQNIRTAAIFGDGVLKFEMDRCTVRHVGAHGVWLRRGCRNCAVTHCLIEDLGCGGVYLGDTANWREERRDRLTGFNRVFDNIIRAGGFSFAGAIGVWVGHASDNEIAHNDISDFRYTGVSMGWTWGYAETVTHRNRLLWNRIHHIGQGVLSDMGGVYTLGNSEGTVEIGNWIHDVNGYRGAGSPAWGLYTDEGSRGILLASNLVEHCRDGAVHQHYGRENTWANNIFATFDVNGVWRSRVEDHTTIIVTNNVFWWTNPKAHLLSGTAQTTVKDVVFEGNCYWGTAGVSPEAFSGRTLEAWRAEGHDLKSIFADPRFVDPAKGDWRLAPDSPARKMGFVPWDWTFAGVLKDDAAWRAEAMDDSRIAPLEDAPQAPRLLRVSARQNFNAFPVGASRGAYGVLVPDAKRGIAVVARDGAADRALRLTDGPDLAQAWQPHLIARVLCATNSVRIRFAFNTDDRVNPQFECRDYRPLGGAPYAIGPSISFSKGVVSAHGRVLARVPTGTWCAVEVVLHVTGARARTWDCTITPSRGEPIHVEGLGLNPAFQVMEWIGFMTNGRESGSWMLDDFSVDPVD